MRIARKPVAAPRSRAGHSWICNPQAASTCSGRFLKRALVNLPRGVKSRPVTPPNRRIIGRPDWSQP